VMLYSRSQFLPAEDNLRIQAMFLALVYLSMPLGISIMAAGRQGIWSLVQCCCVASSLVLDPILISVFQRWTGNGGLGVCVAGIISEMAVLTCAWYLVPKGVFDRVPRLLSVATLAGGAMVAVALIARPLTAFGAAPLALTAYAAALWILGGVEKQQISAMRSMLKLNRAAPVLSTSSN